MLGNRTALHTSSCRHARQLLPSKLTFLRPSFVGPHSCDLNPSRSQLSRKRTHNLQPIAVPSPPSLLHPKARTTNQHCTSPELDTGCIFNGPEQISGREIPWLRRHRIAGSDWGSFEPRCKPNATPCISQRHLTLFNMAPCWRALFPWVLTVARLLAWWKIFKSSFCFESHRALCSCFPSMLYCSRCDNVDNTASFSFEILYSNQTIRHQSREFFVICHFCWPTRSFL